MKRVVLAVLIALIPSIVLAQKSAYKVALNAYENAEYEDAKQVIEKVVLHKKTSRDPKAWELKGHIYRKLLEGLDMKEPLDENFGKTAFEAYQSAVDLLEDKDQMRYKSDLTELRKVLLNYGVSYQMLQKTVEAKSFYQLGIEVSNYIGVETGEFHGMLGALSLREKDYYEAAMAYMRAVDAGWDKEQSAVNTIMALKLAEASEYGIMLMTYRRQFKSNRTLIDLEIDYKVNKGDLDAAEELLTSTVEQFPEEINYAARLGDIKLQKEDEKGVEILEEVLESDPNYLAAHTSLVWYQMTVLSSLNKKYERALESSQQEADEIKVQRDELGLKIVSHAEAVVAQEPDSNITYRTLGILYGMLGDEENLSRVMRIIKK